MKNEMVAFLCMIAIGFGFFGGKVSTPSPDATMAKELQKEKDKTAEAFKNVEERDSLVVLAKEEVLFYKELHAEIKVRFDSIASGTSMKVTLLDSLVRSDFESLNDSVKLAYRNKVLSRLGNRQ